MKILIPFFFLAGLILTGCAQSQTASRRPVDRRNDVVYTGSNIPQPRNRITASPLSANTPADSFARHPDSLVPTEPVVGAVNNAGPRDDTGPIPQGY